MSYNYVSKSDQDLALSLHVRVVKSDDSFAVIGNYDDVKRYLEVCNG